jgi:tetratricopeptide (TPR) repeat protein
LWGNLGLLYLHHQDYEIARQAFLKAQTLDPDFALAWVGQAFAQKGVDASFDTTSLLEHAVGLSAGVVSTVTGSFLEWPLMPGAAISRFGVRQADDVPVHTVVFSNAKNAYN